MNTCRTCRYWQTYDVSDREPDTEGPLTCRFAYAHRVQNDEGDAEWPRTWSTDSCRGYRRAWFDLSRLWVMRRWWHVQGMARTVKWRVGLWWTERGISRRQRKEMMK